MPAPKNLPLREILLVLTVIFSFFMGLGDIPLFDWDEGAFSEASREMLENGNYITAYMNGQVRFAKPILIYWLQAPSLALFGVNEFGARFPSAVAASLWVLALYLFVRHLAGPGRAFLAAFLMTTALQIGVIARAAISDAVLNLFIALSMFCVFLYYRERGTPSAKKYVYGAFIAIGLGTLTKGPIAILIPVFVSFAFFLIRGEASWSDLLRRPFARLFRDETMRHWWAAILNPVGIALFLLIAGPWYYLHYQDQGQNFIESFFMQHNVGRFTSAMEGHSGPIFYYVPVILIGFLPFTTILLRAFTQMRSEWRDDQNLFALLWFGFVFVFFSIGATKLPHYVIYGYTPLFWLMAGAAERVKRDVWLFLPPLMFLLVLFFLPDIARLVSTLAGDGLDEFAQLTLAYALPHFGWDFRLAMAAGVVLFLLLAFVPVPGRLGKLIIAGLALSGLLTFAIFPAYARAAQIPIKEAALFAKSENLQVSVWRFHWPSFLFYSGRLVPQKIPQSGDVLILKETELQYFRDYEVLFSKQGIVLIRAGKIEWLDYARMMLN